jgi:hypothetical protein
MPLLSRRSSRLRDAGFSESQALAAMIEWNETNARPKWTIRELAHKCTDAYKLNEIVGKLK